MLGSGDAFVLRDPCGIRPAWYFKNDEVLAVASERVALMTIFEQASEVMKEVPAGGSIIAHANGEVKICQIMESYKTARCSFERIYFSRGNDPDIYRERKALGAALSKSVIKSINQDFSHAVFSYIPNTAETAYYGLIEELNRLRRLDVKNEILSLYKSGDLTEACLDRLLDDNWPRGEKIAVKDVKLRTFISKEKSRIQLASHIYDIAYGIVGPKDVLVCLDDSIVRGTTLKQSILRILSKANPKKIVIASTAPQIRYPDCYGIDMSELGKFIAFQAAVALLKENSLQELLTEVYEDCVAQTNLPPTSMINHVKRIYEPFSTSQISAKIADLVFPNRGEWKGHVEMIYQSIYTLHESLPNHKGDWYFTGITQLQGGIQL